MNKFFGPKKLREYTIIKKIGAGSFATTFLVQNATGDKFVAKEFNNSQYYNEEVDNYNYINLICGGYFVCMHDHFSINDKFYIIITFVNGITLQEYSEKIPLKSNVSFIGREQRTDVAYHLIMAIDKLHKNGISHQDLNEKNIIWDFSANLPRLIDFGTNCILEKDCNFNGENCDRVCGHLGTNYASPPELNESWWRGKIITRNQSFEQTCAHDLWSLGVILYNWYIVVDTFYKLTLKDFPPNDLINDIQNATLNENIAKILQLLLEQDAQKRFNNWPEILKCVQSLNIITFENGTPKQIQYYEHYFLRKFRGTMTADHSELNVDSIKRDLELYPLRDLIILGRFLNIQSNFENFLDMLARKILNTQI